MYQPNNQGPYQQQSYNQNPNVVFGSRSPGPYQQQPPQEFYKEPEFSLYRYPPFWVSIVASIIIGYFSQEMRYGEERLALVPSVVIGALWSMFLIWPAVCRCMNLAWSIVLVVLTVLLGAINVAIAVNGPLDMVYKVLSLVLLVPMLIASIMTFFFK